MQDIHFCVDTKMTANFITNACNYSHVTLVTRETKKNEAYKDEMKMKIYELEESNVIMDKEHTDSINNLKVIIKSFKDLIKSETSIIIIICKRN